MEGSIRIKKAVKNGMVKKFHKRENKMENFPSIIMIVSSTLVRGLVRSCSPFISINGCGGRYIWLVHVLFNNFDPVFQRSSSLLFFFYDHIKCCSCDISFLSCYYELIPPQKNFPLRYFRYGRSI